MRVRVRVRVRVKVKVRVKLLPEPLAARPLGREEARLPPPQPLEQLRSGAEKAAAMLLLLVLGGAPRSRKEQQPSPTLRAAAEQHVQPGRLEGRFAKRRCPGVVCAI